MISYKNDFYGQSFYLLVQAVVAGDLRTLESWYAAGVVDFNNVRDDEGDPLLIVAMKADNRESFDFLMARGLDLEVRSEIEEWTPLVYAVAMEEYYYVTQLVSAGADVNARDGEGMTPICYAAVAENGEFIEYFLAMPEVDVNVSDNDGITALIAACFYHEEAIDLFLSHPHYDATFHYIVLKSFGLTEIAEYIAKHGPEIDYSVAMLCEEAKIFGLKFDLSGCFFPETLSGHEGYCIPFEGWDNANGAHAMYITFEPFYLQAQAHSGVPEWAKLGFSIVHESLAFAQQETAPQAYYDKILAGDPVVIPSGWDQHSVAIVIHDNRLYVCNRGDGSDGVHGIQEFIITDPEALTPIMIERIMEASGSSLYLTYWLPEFLGLERVGEIENPTQIVGNCVWTSLETSVEALFLTTFIGLGLESESAHHFSKQLFLAWENYDLNRTLDAVLTHPEPYLENGIYDDLLVNVLVSHHEPTDPNELARGIRILNELDDPSVFATFDEKIGHYVMEYDPLGYEKISYLAPYGSSEIVIASYAENNFYSLAEQTQLAKEYFDFLSACDAQAHSGNDIFGNAIDYANVLADGLDVLFDTEVALPIFVSTHAATVFDTYSLDDMVMAI